MKMTTCVLVHSSTLPHLFQLAIEPRRRPFRQAAYKALGHCRRISGEDSSPGAIPGLCRQDPFVPGGSILSFVPCGELTFNVNSITTAGWLRHYSLLHRFPSC